MNDYEEGREFFINANYKKAIKKFKNASKKSPESLQYLYAIGATLFELDEYESSLNYFNQILEKDSSHVKSKLGKIIVLTNMNRFSEALKLIDDSINLHDNGIFYAEKATLLQIMNKPENQVLKNLNKALKNNDDEPYIYYLKGDVHSDYLEWEQALDSYNQALKYPNSICSLDDGVFISKSEIFLRKIGVYDSIKQLSKALDCSKEFFNVFPNNLYALYSISHIYHFMGDNENSLEVLKKALNIDPDSILCLNLKGLILSDKGDYKGALAVYKKILDIDPESEDALSNICLVYFMQKEYQKTFDAAKKALESESKNPYPLYWGSKAARKLGKHDLARKWEEKLNNHSDKIIFLERNLQESIVNDPWRLEKCGYNFNFIKKEFTLKDRPGRIDLLYEDRNNGDYVIVELKNVDATKATYDQILNYMDSIKKTIGRNKKVKGLVIATGQNDRFKKLIMKNKDISYLDYWRLGLG